MTEQESKTKWCPLANSDAVPAERLPPGSTNVREAHARCIGSACMFWRVEVIAAHQQNEFQKERPEGEGWERGSKELKAEWWWRKVPRQEVGYCGIAGKP